MTTPDGWSWLLSLYPALKSAPSLRAQAVCGLGAQVWVGARRCRASATVRSSGNRSA